MATLTPDNVVAELKRRTEPLSQILRVEDFAEPGQLADRLAQELRGLKPTQLRRVFHTIKDMERGFRRRSDVDKLGPKERAMIAPLLPELAYARGRDLIPHKFYEIMRECLIKPKLVTIGDFKILTRFLEAILGYQKYHDSIKKKGGQR